MTGLNNRQKKKTKKKTKHKTEFPSVLIGHLPGPDKPRNPSWKAINVPELSLALTRAETSERRLISQERTRLGTEGMSRRRKRIGEGRKKKKKTSRAPALTSRRFASSKRTVMEWHVRCSRVQINGLRTQKLRPLPWPIAQDEDPRQEKQNALRPVASFRRKKNGPCALCGTLHVMLDPFLFGCRCHGAATTHQVIRSKHPHDHRL